MALTVLALGIRTAIAPAATHNNFQLAYVVGAYLSTQFVFFCITLFWIERGRLYRGRLAVVFIILFHSFSYAVFSIAHFILGDSWLRYIPGLSVFAMGWAMWRKQHLLFGAYLFSGLVHLFIVILAIALRQGTLQTGNAGVGCFLTLFAVWFYCRRRAAVRRGLVSMQSYTDHYNSVWDTIAQSQRDQLIALQSLVDSQTCTKQLQACTDFMQLLHQ